MSVRNTVRAQQVRLVNAAAGKVFGVSVPKGGWIAAVRKALGMSGAQLARRLGVTNAAVYQHERNEPEGAITLRQMEKVAQALGCRFVYAIVPHARAEDAQAEDGRVEDVLRCQARAKAEALVLRASGHMALEQQALPPERLQEEIERMTEDMLRNPPPDFWEER
ncbi:mobile mystery protein A [Nitratidesulfovibrio liaohensis]|uniref:mobile mystery protein A n=1 Tax=Nitratidesulfovibrio liaohensis TaxID=2604158 RepID=UPI0014201A84|nr:mobile mystery protein A [Nitratidesulfovibrio liaohensis]NHZ45601.1 mobile mystery protein A [Nitratidesulfovibrio liaohensis]